METLTAGIGSDWLRARAVASPRALALVVDGGEWSYEALDALVDQLCALLLTRGVRPGDHVAALLPNSLAAVCLIHAAARLGCVLVPLNMRLSLAELDWQIDQADAAWLVCADDERRAGDLSLPSVNIIPLPLAAARLAGALAAVAPAPLAAVERDPATPQAIVFTSGTTGFPKGALITFANHFWSAVASAFRLGVLPGDRWLACMPLYHVGGLGIIFRSCLYGTAVVLQDGFEVEAVSRSLDEDGVTIVSLVPTMLYRLLGARGSRSWPASVRTVLLGGAAAPADLLHEAQASGVPVALTYGLTEAASQVATALPADTYVKPGSPGRPLLFTTVEILGEDGDPVPPGQPGEITVSGPTVMAGYYKDTEATAKTLRGGRLRTGDIGYLDAGGDLWVIDRRSDLIISGGENVYPAEVERVLRQHPAVAAACVVGVPSAEWGQQVAAMVALREPGAADQASIMAYAHEHLAGYKRPRLLVVADELPQTASGKIAKRAVAERLAEAVTP